LYDYFLQLFSWCDITICMMKQPTNHASFHV